MTVELVQQRKGKKVGSDEWFTSAETLAWSLSKLPSANRPRVQQYDLDPAACDEAHCAPIYYTKETNGLVQPWWGHVWINPPFSDIRPWVERAWFATTEWNPKNWATSVSILSPAVRMEQRWWQELIEPFRDGRARGEFQPIITTHFTPRRVNFAYPGSGGKVKQGATFGCVLTIFQRFTY